MALSQEDGVEAAVVSDEGDDVRGYVLQEVRNLMTKSKRLDTNKEKSLVRFATEEVRKGERLGRGKFGTVFEVDRIDLLLSKDGEEKMKGNIIVAEQRRQQMEATEFLRKTSRRGPEANGDARYAIKVLNRDVVEDPNLFQRGSLVLAMEANFLSNLMHPNIITVRAVASDDLLGTANYFIVMDRLYDTLEHRIEQWKMTKKKLGGFRTTSKKKKEFTAEKVNVAFKMSAALAYVHQMGVIYRDLKPENFGFDFRGEVKMFDFGFAKELRDDMIIGQDESGGHLYDLTPCGSLVYMAPEVVLRRPFSDKADVYSYGMMLWEFMALAEPFHNWSTRMHEQRVCRGTYRPNIDKKWPKEVRSLISKCWAKKIGDRLPMKMVHLKLREVRHRI